jgi:hypothetical protein
VTGAAQPKSKVRKILDTSGAERLVASPRVFP